MDMDGNNRMEVRFADHPPPFPFAMTFFESYMYWTDWNTLSLYKVNFCICPKAIFAFVATGKV